jgi:ribosomal protein S18 acetylase RimI-like enzyme
MTKTFTISRATPSDVPALVQLVNSAYRGESSKRGWTTEADLLDGIRTDEENMHRLVEDPNGVMLICRDKQNELLGCVNLQMQVDHLYLGMLTVSPELQGGGIGKKLLQASEQYATANGFGTIIMSVISIRTELIAWYERRGYQRTGETKPFPPSDPRFGIPKQALEFVVLKKKVDKDGPDSTIRK